MYTLSNMLKGDDCGCRKRVDGYTLEKEMYEKSVTEKQVKNYVSKNNPPSPTNQIKSPLLAPTQSAHSPFRSSILRGLQERRRSGGWLD